MRVRPGDRVTVPKGVWVSRGHWPNISVGPRRQTRTVTVWDVSAREVFWWGRHRERCWTLLENIRPAA